MTTSARFDRQALRIVEAAYNLERTTEAWVATVLNAALPALDQGFGMFGSCFGSPRQDSSSLWAIRGQ